MILYVPETLFTVHSVYTFAVQYQALKMYSTTSTTELMYYLVYSESSDLGGPICRGDIVCPRRPCLRYTPYVNAVQYQALKMYSTISTTELMYYLVVYKPYVIKLYWLFAPSSKYAIIDRKKLQIL